MLGPNAPKTRRRFLSLLAVGLYGGLAGCKSMAVGQMQDAPIENRLFLHAGYKIGDYALYDAMGGDMHVLFKIVDVRPGRIEVQLSWPKAPLFAGFMTKLTRRMFLNERGEVLEAFVEDRGSGRRYPLRIAGPGDPNFIGEISEVALTGGQTLRTPAGTFSIRKIIMFSLDLDNGFYKQRVTTAIFFDPQARFGLVRRVDVYAVRVPALELYQQALSFAPLPQGAGMLYSYMLSKVGDVKPWEMSLLESG